MVHVRFHMSRFWKWVLGIAGFCFLLIIVLPYVMHSDALRQYAERPNVRIYADHIEASFKDFSNQLAEGPSEFQMRGRFMGSGDTRVTGTFRPESADR